MKETSPLRQVSGSVYSSSTRDLDMIFEENDHHHHMMHQQLPQSQQQQYQSSTSLNFLRPKPTYSTSYSATDTPASSSSAGVVSPATVRRPRAGTMPSFIHPDMRSSVPGNSTPTSSAALLLNTIEAGRHRSGSLNLPPPPVDSFWLSGHDGPLSPSSEQLLQNDSDFSIARTMRSLGLEEEEQKKEPMIGLFHQQSPPEFHMPSRSLLSGNNRNRSYSVNATARYEEPPFKLPNALEGFTRQQVARPRASSMGRADAGHLPPPMGFWNNRGSPLVSMREEDYETSSTTSSNQQPLSLGDSELLANILGKEEDNYDEEAPYLHFSQSTPTSFSNNSPPIQQQQQQQQQIQQAATRSLWVGNIDHTVTIDLLTQVFSNFGAIESVRLLVEKECGFVNFFQTEDAVRAKEEVLGRMGGRIGQCIVRIGYGKADAAVTETNVLQPTRALWLGNIPGNTTPTSLQSIFAVFGQIESVRVLSHKNCGFINFESVNSAVKARDALMANEIGAQGFTGARVGFAKIPPHSATTTAAKPETEDSDHYRHQTAAAVSSAVNAQSSAVENGSNLMQDATIAWQNDLFNIMCQFNMNDAVARNFVKDLKTSSPYFDSIPAVPELGPNRKFDAASLREMRKRMDSATDTQEEAELVALECMEDIAEISSDYIGNTVVQRLFEKCTEKTKTKMLERIAPHLAAISIHKNGTWATQKIIDLAKTPEQIQLISRYLKPYIPPLLLDQFGNYAVQCCLRLGSDKTQFIFDSMVEKLMNIAQGRFGARSMRGILESEFVTENQRKFTASALVQNALALSTNTNGALLLSWLIESTDIDHRMQSIATRLIPHLSQLCIHKLGSQIIYKLVNQTSEKHAQQLIMQRLLSDQQGDVLADILADQVRGLVFVQKLIVCPLLTDEQKKQLSGKVCAELENLNGPGHKKLLGLLLETNTNSNNNHVD
ncbi:unnamed protein product [Mucor circinelloides]